MGTVLSPSVGREAGAPHCRSSEGIAGTPTVPSTARGYGWRPRDTKCGVWAMDAMWPATFRGKDSSGLLQTGVILKESPPLRATWGGQVTAEEGTLVGGQPAGFRCLKSASEMGSQHPHNLPPGTSHSSRHPPRAPFCPLTPPPRGDQVGLRESADSPCHQLPA